MMLPRGGERPGGTGKNKRTAEYVGGCALPGSIIGAIAGGREDAAIGAAAGAGTGAGTQVLTQGEKVYVPANPLITFARRNLCNGTDGRWCHSQRSPLSA
jgi:hypothetical protein